MIIYRLPENNFFSEKRSYCPRCKKMIAWYDNIPLLSFLILKGKCRHCREKISWQYPLVELLTALLFICVLIFKFQVSSFDEISLVVISGLFFYLFVACVLLLVFVFDFKYYIIPDEIVFPAVFISLAYFLFSNSWENYWQIIFLLLPAVFFAVLIIFSKGEWMGWGDVKFVIFMALALGWPNIAVALFLAFVGGSVVGLFLVFFKAKTMKSALPFGAFLAPASFIALIWGEKLIDWYFSLFGFLA